MSLLKNIIIAASVFSSAALAATTGPEKFAQLGHLLNTPTATRLASGAPGPDYWQQRADYRIEVT